MCVFMFLLDLDILIKLDFFKFISFNEVKIFFFFKKLVLATSYFHIKGKHKIRKSQE